MLLVGAIEADKVALPLMFALALSLLGVGAYLLFLRSDKSWEARE